MKPGAVVVQGNALALPLPDESVDLIITSPPYFALRSYRDDGTHYDGQIGSEPTPQGFLEALWAATAEMVRVLKPTGSMWINLGDKYASGHGGRDSVLGEMPKTRTHHAVEVKERPDLLNPPASWSTRNATDKHVIPGFRPKTLMGMPWRYAIGCIDQLGLILRAEVIWSKPNGLPESVTDRVRRSHEQWFHMVKQGRYFSAVDEIREPQMRTGGQTSPGLQMHSSNDGLSRRGFTPRHELFNPLGKLPGSVWTIPSEPLIIPPAVQHHYNLPDHFAAFPQEWPRRIILGWSPSGGIVLDPFGGTGTVSLVARALGRYGMSVDLSHDYCRLAKWRIFQSGHAAKTENRTNAERQEGLF